MSVYVSHTADRNFYFTGCSTQMLREKWIFFQISSIIMLEMCLQYDKGLNLAIFNRYYVLIALIHTKI